MNDSENKKQGINPADFPTPNYKALLSQIYQAVRSYIRDLGEDVPIEHSYDNGGFNPGGQGHVFMIGSTWTKNRIIFTVEDEGHASVKIRPKNKMTGKKIYSSIKPILSEACREYLTDNGPEGVGKNFWFLTERLTEEDLKEIGECKITHFKTGPLSPDPNVPHKSPHEEMIERDVKSLFV